MSPPAQSTIENGNDNDFFTINPKENDNDFFTINPKEQPIPGPTLTTPPSFIKDSN
jgi:hypothetical protein